MAKHESSTCPNCGYCPHCGRSNPSPMRPRPWPYPYGPYWSVIPPYQIGDFPGYGTVSISAGSTSVSPQTRASVAS